MGFCCKGVSKILSVLFNFLAVKQTKSHNVIFIPDPKIKQLVLCKIMANCKVVIFFFWLWYGLLDIILWAKLFKSLLCGKFLWLHGINPLLFFSKIPASGVLTTRNLRFHPQLRVLIEPANNKKVNIQA